VVGNITRNNHLNGIMMDESSNSNLIRDNIAEHNRGDGIVVASSSHNRIVGNSVRSNRVGIHVRGQSDGNMIRGNSVSENAKAAEGTDLVGNSVRGNGGQWRPGVIATVWIAAVLLALALCLFSARTRRRTRRSIEESAVGRPTVHLQR
jgi:parallel beta-helix repeat protein